MSVTFYTTNHFWHHYHFFRGISTAKGLELIDDYLKRYEPAKTGNKSEL